MRFRRLTLLVVIYVALDLANPMMPGAVQLVGPSLEMVDGCKPRSDDGRAPTLPAIPHQVVPVAPGRKPVLRGVVRTDHRCSFLSAPLRCPPEPSRTASPSSDDD